MRIITLQEDRMGLRLQEQSEEDTLVYQTGHRDDRISAECVIQKVKLRNGQRAACNHGVMDARGRLLSTKEA